MLSHPARDTLPNADLDLVDRIGVRVLRRTQYQVVAFEDVHEAGVALDDVAQQLDNASEHGLQRVGGGQAAADLVK